MSRSTRSSVATSGVQTTASPALVVGIGCRASATGEDVRRHVGEVLARAGLSTGHVVLVATLETRTGHPAVAALAAVFGVPVRGLSADELQHQDVPHPSTGVARAVGTASVAEAAVLACSATLLVGKDTSRTSTVAVGRLVHGPGQATVDVCHGSSRAAPVAVDGRDAAATPVTAPDDHPATTPTTQEDPS